MKSKYDHTTGIHVMKDPMIIAPILFERIQPKSVVDIGCGLGTFAKVFKDLGSSEVLGIDGHWNDPNLRRSFLNDEEFMFHDLEQPLKMNKKFDLVISLEVAEHLDPNAAETFLDSLTNSGDIILFSAAVPFQGGQNHINEQWIDYWEEKFNSRNFRVLDCIRPLIWDNEEVYWWYKQNTFMVISESREDLIHQFEPLSVERKTMVHPQHYLGKSKELYAIQGGSKSIIFYIKLLIKGILNKFGFKFYQNNHTNGEQ